MLRLLQIPALSDNYIWLLAQGQRCIVVDPAEADPVLGALTEHGLTLAAILNTHHHADHVGGNRALVEKTGCEVLGPAHDRARIPCLTRPVSVGDAASVLGLTFRVLDVHAHTRGHIAYALDTPVDEVVRHGHGGQPLRIDRLGQRPVLFVGDSLFLAGCGRLFEGTADELAAVMEVYLGEDPEALVCCAHEYTAGNLRFAAAVLEENPAIADRLMHLDDERAVTRSSVPDTLARERATNPFLLAFDEAWAPAVARYLGVPADDKPLLVGGLRAAKDTF